MQTASKAWLWEIWTMAVAHLLTSVNTKTVKITVSLLSMAMVTPRMATIAGARDLDKSIGISATQQVIFREWIVMMMDSWEAQYKREANHLPADLGVACPSLGSNRRKVSRSPNLLAVLQEVDPTTQMRSRKLLAIYPTRIIVNVFKVVALVDRIGIPKKSEKVGSLIQRAKLNPLSNHSKRTRAVLTRNQMQVASSRRKMIMRNFLIT